jgi:hypothetical protein
LNQTVELRSLRLERSQVIMPTAHSSPSKEVVTAALLVIGGKILFGRTKDQNIYYIAEYLTAVGINLREVRVVGDEERAIIDALNRSGVATPMSSPPAGSSRPTVTSPPTAWRRRSVCQLTAIRARSPYSTNG